MNIKTNKSAGDKIEKETRNELNEETPYSQRLLSRICSHDNSPALVPRSPSSK
jgi:hypothetical protein